MMGVRKHNLVLGIYPDSRGFAFVVFEGPLAPVDWGTAEARGEGKIRKCMARIGSLFGKYEPDVLVLQDMSESGTRRANSIRNLNDAIALLAETQSIPTFFYSRTQVRKHFAPLGALNKDAIASVIAKRIPVFDRLRPPVRKLWTNEHARMPLFDATALVLTFYEDDNTQ
jgi:Holliday junction resolvasome RuvABC endonuclease subunit